MIRNRLAPFVIATLALIVEPALAEEAKQEPSTEELAKLAQNPVANLVSIPFRNTTTFGHGPANAAT